MGRAALAGLTDADDYRPRPNFVRHDREDGGYYAIWKGGTVGAVVPVYLPSHIRRGRQQTEPHWQAIDTTTSPIERAVGSPKRSRLEAGRLLLDIFLGWAPR